MTQEEIGKLARDAYNEGFSEGMKEHTHSRGGKSWRESEAKKRFEASPISSQDRGTQ